MEIIDQVKERLSIKNFYDVIRIVDPVKKVITIVTDNKMKELNGTCCCALWQKNTFCENCISMRAYVNNDTFIKLEYGKEKIMLITATPIELDGNTFIVEILKDITQNKSVLHKLAEDSNSVEEFISSMNEKIVKDEITGLYNKEYINERLSADINNSKISNMPLSIIMTDIDFLKKVNHEYGYVIGDKILIDFSDLILKSIRNNCDWAGRFGGEEFIIVLNNTNLKDAYNVAEKIRKELKNTTFNYAGININITASFGVYNIKSNDVESLDLLTKVEKNLCKAKASGRNRTIINQDNINGVKTENIKQKAIKLSGLNKHINEIREILNEVCCTVDAGETVEGRLIVSEYLDELIVEYMKELNDLK